jgi:ATP-binding cassette subfamily B protein AbcA/BmrA
MRSQLWGKLLRLPVKYFDDHKSGEIASRLVNDTTQVKNLLANTLPNMLTSLLQLVGALVLMLMMDWKMTLLMFVCVPLVVIVIMPVARLSRKIAFARQDELAAFSGQASEIFGEIRLVKSSTAEATEKKSGLAKTQSLYKLGVREALYDSIARPIMSVVMLGLVFGMLAYGASRVAQGSMTMGALVSLLMYLVQLIGPFATIGQLVSEVSKASGSTARIQQVFSAQEEPFDGGDRLAIEHKSLSMEDVGFSYDEGKPVLNGVSFEAQPNSVIAFAGPSGGGKSTIFSLVERFYTPDSGHLLIGNEEVDHTDLEEWRRQIGFVSQDAAVLDGSIRYNLTYGLDGDWSDAALWDVLGMAYARDFVADMPEGLDTLVGERGVKLSGGQRQRIAIARAFLRDPKILMLDEATASLDSESEMMVQRALEKLMKGRTTLVIAHRLSTIVGADQLYFIEQGRVSGHGTHDQLVASHDTYREYVHNQFSEKRER